MEDTWLNKAISTAGYGVALLNVAVATRSDEDRGCRRSGRRSRDEAVREAAVVGLARLYKKVGVVGGSTADARQLHCDRFPVGFSSRGLLCTV